MWLVEHGSLEHAHGCRVAVGSMYVVKVQTRMNLAAHYKVGIAFEGLDALPWRSLFGCVGRAVDAQTLGRLSVVYKCSCSHRNPLSGHPNMSSKWTE